MSDIEEDLLDVGEPPSIDPYEVLELQREATANEIKKAYRKAALQHHPDKVPDDPVKKRKAHETFQEIALAYAVLSDPSRRKRYDQTGSTSESIIDAEGFDWSDYYRSQFRDAVSSDAIARFAEQYKGSDEEKDDLLAAFELCEGDMDLVYQHVILSDVLEDDERFREILDEAVEKRDVPQFKAYLGETKKKREERVKKARKEKEKEATEAEDYARELGVHDKLFGAEDEAAGKNGKTKTTTKKKKGSSEPKSEDSLAALIQQRQKDRANNDDFFDHLAEKYGGGGGAAGKKGKKSSKRGPPEDDDEPSEEAFAAMGEKYKANKSKRLASKKARS